MSEPSTLAPGSERRDSPLDDTIARQYGAWVYPLPVDDLAAVALERRDNADPSLHHRLYWPDREYPDALDILVAGCGTVQAAEIAFHNPRARVLGIDVSDASLAHEQRLKAKHGLQNLELRRLPIEEAGSLGRDFDLIISSGVLHHLADPLAGMAALGRCLRLEGVLAVYLYGKLGRVGIDLLHSLFQRAGLRQDAASLTVVRATLERLIDSHPMKAALPTVGDLHFDAGVVDLFLNARQRSYTAEDCIAMAAAAGLVFQGWTENAYYHPEAYLQEDHPLRDAIARLPPAEMWMAMDEFAAQAGHGFLLCRTDRPREHYEIEFSSARWLDYVPILRHGTQIMAADPATGAPTLVRRGQLQYPLTDDQALILRHMDGKRAIRAILDSARPPEPERSGRTLFRLLWRLGVISFRLPAA